MSSELQVEASKMSPVVIEAFSDRTNPAMGLRQFNEKVARAKTLGYMEVYRRYSGARRACRSAWLAPNRGFDGMKSWAVLLGAIHVQENPGLIVVLPGKAGAIIGPKGAIIRSVASHSQYKGFMRVIEARTSAGTIVSVTAPLGYNNSLRQLQAHHHTGKSPEDCWWVYDDAGATVVILHPYGDREFRCNREVPELRGQKTNWLAKEEIIGFEDGEPQPRYREWFPGKFVADVTQQQLRTVWEILKKIQGYEIARKQL